MRGAREFFYEYILELHGRRGILVGRDGKCPLQQESIAAEQAESSAVLDKAGSVSCL